MKHLLYSMLVVLGAAAFMSCSKDDDNGNESNNEPYISFVMQGKVDEDYFLRVYTFNEGDIITIDWGNGKIEKFESIERGDDYGIDIVPNYTEKPRKIVVKGNIKNFCGETPRANIAISSLDVSKCPELVRLSCENAQLTSLDISKNTELTFLNCSGNPLKSLDISNNLKLTQLLCWNNQLTTLDVSKHTKLEELFCSRNQLTSLDISNNLELTILKCTENQLHVLDVSKNAVLRNLSCEENPLTTQAMNEIYKALPAATEGYISCNRLGDWSIAEQKGWHVVVYD